MPFVKSNEELEIVKCSENSIVIGKLEQWDELLKIVSKWRLYIGIPKKESDIELSIVTEFIANTYPFLTLSEIELAYNLSIARKLEDVEFFGSFSPLYCAKVIDSYLYYRKITMADTLRRKERWLQEQAEIKNRPTPQQQAEDTKDIIANFYKQYKDNGEINDVLNITYNFLRNNKMLKVTQSDIDEGMIYAKEKFKKKNNNVFIKLNDSDDYEIKIYARNYIVQKYFQNVDIDILLNNIKSENFL